MHGSFLFHLSTLTMSSSVYQPAALSFVSFFSFFCLFTLNLTNCSCQDRLGNHFAELEKDQIPEPTSTHRPLEKKQSIFWGRGSPCQSHMQHTVWPLSNGLHFATHHEAIGELVNGHLFLVHKDVSASLSGHSLPYGFERNSMDQDIVSG